MSTENIIVQTKKPEGFTVTMFKAYPPVIIFPNSNSFERTMGVAIGLETCNLYGTKRLIARYTTPPKRKISGVENHWPNGIVYLNERDVEGYNWEGVV